MDECPHCEYNKKRAQNWRVEAYRLAGYPLPEQEPVGWIDSRGNMICTKINESCKPLYTTPQPKQEQGEPMALKKGECWPEEVMRQWDYWRKEIANGHKGSAPRDWFEGLSEIKLIDTTPQRRKWVDLTDDEKKNIFLKWYGKHWAYTSQVQSMMDSVEAKLKEKNT